MHVPISVGEHAGPLKASRKVFEAVMLLPPAVMADASMFTALELPGVVNEYHTSLVVPHPLVFVPSLLLLNKLPVTLLQLVATDNGVGELQTSDCAELFLDRKTKRAKRTRVRLKD